MKEEKEEEMEDVGQPGQQPGQPGPAALGQPVFQEPQGPNLWANYTPLSSGVFGLFNAPTAEEAGDVGASSAGPAEPLFGPAAAAAAPPPSKAPPPKPWAVPRSGLNVGRQTGQAASSAHRPAPRQMDEVGQLRVRFDGPAAEFFPATANDPVAGWKFVVGDLRASDLHKVVHGASLGQHSGQLWVTCCE